MQPFMDIQALTPDPGPLKCVWIPGADGLLESIWIPDWESESEATETVVRKAG
jgi:hypothetical protein